MARTLVWKILSGSYGSAANWDDTTTPLNPAASPPDGTDTAEIEGASGGTVSGDGAANLLQFGGGAWTTTGALTVGELDVFAPLTIKDSIAAASRIHVGQTSGTTGNVTVSSGASLSISGPAQTSFYAIEIGYMGAGGIVLDGAGATLSTNGNGLRIADFGTGSLFIGGGATASMGSNDSNLISALVVGQNGGSSGAITVTGSGSTLTADGSVRIGRGGTGTLVVADHGSVSGGSTDFSLAIGYGNSTVAASQGGTGAATVTGGGHLFSAGSIDIGFNAVTGKLTVSDGGVVEATDRIVAGSGATSLLGSSGTINIGAGGTVKSDGPHVQGVSAIALGGVAGAVGAINVSGAGALLDAGGDYLTVGSIGRGALTVTNGGTVKTGTQYATDGAFTEAAEAGSTGAVTVSGTGSSIIALGQFNVGNAGTGSLLIENGGLVKTGNVSTLSPNQGLAIGRTTGAIGQATITGAGSQLVNVGRFSLGGQTATLGGGQGSLLIAGGATVTTSLPTGATTDGADIGAIAGGTGAVTVTGTGSSLSIADNLVIGTGGTGTLDIGTGATVSAGAVLVGAHGTVDLLGGVFDPPAAATISGGGALTGSGTFDGAVENDGTITAENGNLAVTGAISGTGALDIGHNGTLELAQSVVATQTVTFADMTGDLTLDDVADFHATVYGFQTGDVIKVQNITLGSSTYVDHVLTLFSTSHTVLGTISFDAAYTMYANATPGPSPVIITSTDTPCFLKGTRILTDRGEVAVEALQPGDHVALARGGFRRVIWIGHRALDAATHPAPNTMLPIRVRRDAFGLGRPSRDLWLSPAHAIAAEGVLIPVDRLLNGATITRDTMTRRPHYFHVELDAHDVMVADGLDVESYLDTGNRCVFANGGTPLLLHPDLSLPTREQGCAPFHIEGEIVTRVRRHLLDRLAALGYRKVRNDAAVVLRVDGTSIRPVSRSGSIVRFVLPPNARDVRIGCTTAAPADMSARSDDTRDLGIGVTRLIAYGADAAREIALDDPALSTGWHPWEREGARLWRWTRGNAVLPLGHGCVMVEITIMASPNHWEHATDGAEASEGTLRAA